MGDQRWIHVARSFRRSSDVPAGLRVQQMAVFHLHRFLQAVLGLGPCLDYSCLRQRLG
ncbi:unnamed protein product, partial [Nesidiocoris tenuis]